MKSSRGNPSFAFGFALQNFVAFFFFPLSPFFIPYNPPSLEPPPTMTTLNDLVPSGVITGDHVLTLFEHARAHGYAIPAINCTR